MEEDNKLISSQKECPNCGGDLIFGPKCQELFCEKCGSICAINHSDNVITHKLDEKRNEQNYREFIDENKLFKCPNCGSNVILNKYEVARKCPYCNTSLVLSDDAFPSAKPDGVIPFCFDEDSAGKKFIAGVKKKWFVPNAFKKQLPTNKIFGIYIPSFCYNVKTFSTYKGVLYRSESSTNNEGHAVTNQVSFSVNGNLGKDFENVLVESSSKLSQSQISAILPYNYSYRQVYQNGFIRGYSVEQYDTTVDSCKEIYKNCVDDAIRKEILAKYSHSGIDYLNVSTNYSNETYSYYLVPVYRFEYEYKQKKYLTIMNGQTGAVGDNLPKSKLKMALMAILLLLVLALPFIIAIIQSLVEK